jgi:stage V sporulation protein G
MKVTEVKIFPVADDKLKAFVSVVLDACFMVNDIKVIEGRDGRFISMPSRRKRNGKFKDIAHPLNSDTRQMLEAEILGEYDRVLEAGGVPSIDAEGDGDGAQERATDDGATSQRSGRRRRSRRRGGERNRDGAEARPSVSDGDGAEASAATDGAPRPAAEAEPQSRPQSQPRPEPQSQPAAEADPPSTLEEVTERHLSDSFWTS